MHDLMECTRCGHLFREDQAIMRVRMRAVGHLQSGDCEPAEHLPACPECCCTDLDEPILSAADLESRLGVMYPGRSIEVRVEARRFMHGSRAVRSLLVQVEVQPPRSDPDRRPVTATGLTLRAAIRRTRRAEARRQGGNEPHTITPRPRFRRAAPRRMNTPQNDGDQ